MLALFVVNTFDDIDNDNVVVGSLRQAVNLANANAESDTIIFRPDLFDGGFARDLILEGGMNGGPLLLSAVEGVQIIGPGPGLLTIHAAPNNRIFLMDDGDENNRAANLISGVTLDGGAPLGDDEEGRGGAIINRENLTLREVRVSNNFATEGGAIFNDEGGRLLVDRSLIENNTAELGGGGIQNGLADQDENLPFATIRNSTITGNMALGIPGDDGEPTGYGGGVLNFAGNVYIEQSTIVGNSAPVYGGGVASQGFDPMIEVPQDPPPDGEEPPPPEIIEVTSGLATTHFRSSIIVGNTGAMDAPDDVGSVGMTEGDEMNPPMPFEPQLNSMGYNVFGTLTHPGTTVNMDVVLPPNGPGGMVGVTDVDGVGVDEIFFVLLDAFGNPILDDNGNPIPIISDFGGVLPVFMLDASLINNPAIDHGDPNAVGEYDQRGFQFVRVDTLAGGTPIMDVGAVETQVGNFVVNTLVDELDGRYADVPFSEGTFPNNSPVFAPDMSLREALLFAELNALSGHGDTSTITFSSGLNSEEDPTIGTPAPTILFDPSLGQIAIDFPVIIQGPAFDLELDANDPTPGIKNGDGRRVFSISSTVEISNLILRGGDQQEFGGALLNSGDLTLRNMTFTASSTTGNGGAIYNASGNLLLDSSTVHANQTSGSGGGVYVAGGNVTIHNSTISGNTAALRGGGVANANGDLLIRYSTITNNTASSTQGSGLASFRDGGATTNVRSSIIAGNTINDVQHVLAGTNNIFSLGYNVVGNGNAVAAGVFSMPGDQSNITNPMLSPLTRLGGPTPVHRLLPGSPAINAGDPNSAGLGNVPQFDQRGFPFDRIEGGDPIDVGSFETQDDVFLVGDGSVGEGSYSTFVAALEDSNLTPTMETIVFLPTWPGETFPDDLVITDSVDVIGNFGNRFFGATLVIDNGSTLSTLDVTLRNFRFDSNTRILSQENLTILDMQFVSNALGGAISQQNGDLTILNSTFTGNSGATGGAIHMVNGDLHMENSFLSGNTAVASGGKGGAIYLRNGDFTGTYLYLTGNSAPASTGDGGALYVRDATVTLNNTIISGNSTSGSNSEGGGLAIRDSDVTLINSYVTFNSTSGSQSSGGGIFINGGSLTIAESTVSLNTTQGQASSGGGIASVNANVTITRSMVSANEVNSLSAHGGGIYAVGGAAGGNLTVRDSAVTNNHANAAGSKGGGIYSDTNLFTQTASIINSTVSGNTATHRGGGVYNADGRMQISYSTITDNYVPYFGNGGGVASFGNSSTTRTEVRSTIISGNRVNANTDPLPNPVSDVDNVGGNSTNSFVSLGYNLIGNGVPLALNAFTQTGDIRNILDPLLAPLANNGGPTNTHAILPESPAINAGDPNAIAGIGNVPDYDQRGAGFSRVVNGRIDIGAFESNLSPVISDPGDFDNDGDVDGLDFLAWQLNPGVGNLADWEANYGTQPPPLQTSVATAPEPAAASESLIVNQETSAIAVLAEPAPQVATSGPDSSGQTASESPNPAKGSSVYLTSLGLTASDSLSSERSTAEVDDTAAIDASLTAYGETHGNSPRLADDSDFEDIAVTRHPRDEDGEAEDEFAAEDSAFELLGAEAF